MIRIIDNKKLDITDDEFKMYKQLCEQYEEKYCKGEELFKGIFQVNDSGIIIFVKPQHNKKFSMEIYCFMISVMVNQHLRVAQKQQEIFIEEAKQNHIKALQAFGKKAEMFDKYVEYMDVLKTIKNTLDSVDGNSSLKKLKESISETKKLLAAMDV